MPIQRLANGIELHVTAGAIELVLKVVPGASRARVLGPHGTGLRAAVAAAPERGRANEAVCELLSELLGVRRQSVSIIGGATSRTKRVRICCGDSAPLAATLGCLGA